jgi:hypothetical protein
MQWNNPRNSRQFLDCGRRVHCLRGAPEIFLIISPGCPIKWFHMFGELKGLGTSRSCTLGSVIIDPMVIHRNYVINFYSHMTSSYNLTQGCYSWIQRESITLRMGRVCNKLKSRLLICLWYVRYIFNKGK